MTPAFFAALAIPFFIACALIGSWLGKRAAAQTRAAWAEVVGQDNQDLLDMDKEQLWATVKRLRGAIRAHRDEKGHDRCWLDDVTLYDALPERPKMDGGPPGIRRLPSREAFLANCERYHAHRHDPSQPYLREADVEAVAAEVLAARGKRCLPLLADGPLLPPVDGVSRWYSIQGDKI